MASVECCRCVLWWCGGGGRLSSRCDGNGHSSTRKRVNLDGFRHASVRKQLRKEKKKHTRLETHLPLLSWLHSHFIRNFLSLATW